MRQPAHTIETVFKFSVSNLLLLTGFWSGISCGRFASRRSKTGRPHRRHPPAN